MGYFAKFKPLSAEKMTSLNYLLLPALMKCHSGRTWCDKAPDHDNFDVAAVFRACGEKLDRNSVPDYIQVVDETLRSISS